MEIYKTNNRALIEMARLLGCYESKKGKFKTVKI